MLDFKNYLSVEKYKEIDAILMKSVYSIKEESVFCILRPILFQYLTDLKKHNILKPIKYSEGHDAYFILAWNKLFEETNEASMKKELNQLISGLFHIFPLDFISDISMPNREQYNYDLITNKITQGDFKYFEVSPCLHMCSGCGQDFHIVINQWQATLLGYALVLRDGYNPEDGDSIDSHIQVYRQPDSCMPKELNVETIEFKTGNVLVTKWIDIEEFNHVVIGDNVYGQDSRKERLDWIHYFLTEFNFLSIPSFSSSTMIFQQENEIIISNVEGYEDEEFEEMSQEYFSHHHQHGNGPSSKVTIIEEEQLLKILMDSGQTEKKAQQLLKRYIKNTDECTQIKLEPGIYKAQFSIEPKMLNQYLPEEEKMPIQTRPVFILKSLNHKPVLKNKKTKSLN